MSLIETHNDDAWYLVQNTTTSTIITKHHSEPHTRLQWSTTNDIPFGSTIPEDGIIVDYDIYVKGLVTGDTETYSIVITRV